MITLRHATLDERRTTYEWYSHLASQDNQSCWMIGDVYSWEAYKRDFEDFYFEEAGRNKGSVMMIENDGEDIGCVCYTCFHLKPHAAELDIWLKDESITGKGYGTEALKALVKYLHEERDIERLIIRPLKRNTRAIKAYTKVGFRPASDTRAVISAYMKAQYTEVYGEDSEHGTGTTTMVMELK